MSKSKSNTPKNQRFNYIAEFSSYVVKCDGVRIKTVKTPQIAGLIVARANKIENPAKLKKYLESLN